MRYITFIICFDVYHLTEVKRERSHSKYLLQVNGKNIGTIHLFSHLMPAISISRNFELVIYGSSTAYLVQNKKIRVVNTDYEINKIWFLENSRMLIQQEICISEYNIFDLLITKEYDHLEIITDSIFKYPNRLIFQDLQNGVYELNLENFIISPSDFPFVRL